MSNKVIEVISNFMTAYSNCSLYSKDHPSVLQISARAVNAMEQLFEDDTLRLTILGDNMYVNDRPFTEKSIHTVSFIRHLRRKGIEKIFFRAGITGEELKAFVAALTLAEGTVTGSPHISAGIVEVLMKSEDDEFIAKNIEQIKALYDNLAEAGEHLLPEDAIEDALSALKETEQAEDAKDREHREASSHFKKLDMVGIEDVVSGMISALRKEINILKLLSPSRPATEYAFVHAANVSALSLFQAAALGLEGEQLQDVGIAGLLHDIGKAFIAGDLVERESALSKEEWNTLKKHPVYGAIYLSTLPDAPSLAVIAAHQHHMKFDGTGYPGRKKNETKPHPVSRIVAIADFFDTMRIGGGAGREMDAHVIAGLLKDSAGKDFDPQLVDNFLIALKKSEIIR